MAAATRLDFAGAVTAGIIDAETAARLAEFYDRAAIDPAGADPDDERFRLVTGFNDIFVTTGIGLLFGSLLFFGSAGAFVVAIVAWGLAEIFTRRRRMALPSIVLAISFVCAVIPLANRANVFADGFASVGALSCALTIIAAAAAHYWRFRVAIDVSLGVCGVGLALLWTLLTVSPQTVDAHHGAIAFAYGVAVFALAMHFDRSDPERKTHRADIAFWLHLQAAPLVVNGLLGGVVVGRLAQMSGVAALLTLVVATLFTIVAIIVDRRALIVSSLAYVGAALLMLVKSGSGHDGSWIFIVMLLGAAVLALSVGWRPIRQRLLMILPLDLSKARLPPAHIENR